MRKLVAVALSLVAAPATAAPSVTHLNCKGKERGYWNITLSEVSSSATVYTYPADGTSTAPAIFTDDEVKIDFAKGDPKIEFYWTIDRATLKLRHFIGMLGLPAEEKFASNCSIVNRPARKF